MHTPAGDSFALCIFIMVSDHFALFRFTWISLFGSFCFMQIHLSISIWSILLHTESSQKSDSGAAGTHRSMGVSIRLHVLDNLANLLSGALPLRPDFYLRVFQSFTESIKVLVCDLLYLAGLAGAKEPRVFKGFKGGHQSLNVRQDLLSGCACW